MDRRGRASLNAKKGMLSKRRGVRAAAFMLANAGFTGTA